VLQLGEEEEVTIWGWLCGAASECGRKRGGGVRGREVEWNERNAEVCNKSSRGVMYGADPRCMAAEVSNHQSGIVL
jgi:hypothetical protein